jgi:hypothetical protein
MLANIGPKHVADCNTSLMKYQFVVTHRYKIVEETEKTWHVFKSIQREAIFFADTTFWQKVCY